MTPDPGPVPAPALDLDAIRAELANVDLGDGAAGHALAETLLAEVERLRAERAALDATPPWEDPDTERPRLLAENAHLAAEYEALKAEAQEEISDLHRSYGDDMKRLRRKLKRAKAFVASVALYPTADAYEAACAALEKHRQRADDAERERDALLVERERVRARVAEEIAAAIEAQDDHGYGMYRSAYTESAAIAREHATAPPAHNQYCRDDWAMYRGDGPREMGPDNDGCVCSLAPENYGRDAAWKPAKTGDTPGQLAPGEGDAPEPVVLGPVGTVMLAQADEAEGPHRYLSTGCYHRLCDDPRPDGTPACRVTCKWCDARCACSCHLGTDG